MVDRRSLLRAVGAASVALAGCNGLNVGDRSRPEPTDTATRTADTAHRVSMNGSNAAGQFYFGPVGLHVQPGDTVEWEAASGQHSTKAFHPTYDQPQRIPDGSDPWYSGAMSYSRFEHTFEVEGTYDYFCSIHYTHAMVGRIVVGEPGGPAEGTQTPYGPVPDADRIVEEGAVSYGAFEG